LGQALGGVFGLELGRHMAFCSIITTLKIWRRDLGVLADVRLKLASIKAMKRIPALSLVQVWPERTLKDHGKAPNTGIGSSPISVLLIYV
jgi:hypothetical protein